MHFPILSGQRGFPISTTDNSTPNSRKLQHPGLKRTRENYPLCIRHIDLFTRSVIEIPLRETQEETKVEKDPRGIIEIEKIKLEIEGLKQQISSTTNLIADAVNENEEDSDYTPSDFSYLFSDSDATPPPPDSPPPTNTRKKLRSDYDPPQDSN